MSKALLTGVLVTFFALSGTVSGVAFGAESSDKWQVICESSFPFAAPHFAIEEATKALNVKIAEKFKSVPIKQMSAPAITPLADGRYFRASVCVSIVTN